MLSRSVASCGTVKPRYSVTYTATDVRNFSSISLTEATLLGVAMVVLPLVRPPGPRCLTTKKPRAEAGHVASPAWLAGRTHSCAGSRCGDFGPTLASRATGGLGRGTSYVNEGARRKRLQRRG